MNFEQIKKNYKKGLWNEQMLKVAVKKGVITEVEMKEIIEEDKE